MPAPLLLLPGLICDARMFAAQTVCWPDAIAWNGFGRRRSLVEMAEDVIARMPARVSLLGHSMGARVALEIVRRAPRRVERLALVSTGVHPVQEGEGPKRGALVELGRVEGAAALVDRWLPPMIAPANRTRADVVEPLRTMCIDNGVEVFAAQVAALLGRPEVETLLPLIRCPTLVACGEADLWSPPEQHRAIAAAIPGARLAIFQGAGHMLPAEAPDAFNDLVAAWLEQPATTPVSQGEDA